MWEPCGVGAGGRPGTPVWVLARARGLAWCWLGAGNPSPRHGVGGPARQKWGGGVEHSDRTLLRGLVQMCSVQDPWADPELSAAQADPQGPRRGQAAGHAGSPLQISLACMLQRCSGRDRAGPLAKGSELPRTDGCGGAGVEACWFFWGALCRLPCRGRAAGERRQTDGVGPEGTGSALLVSHFALMSLSCSHLQIPSLSL